MRKASGISLAALLALLLAGCGDDSSSCDSDCGDAPDASASEPDTETEVESETEATETETETTETETETVSPEAGTTTETETDVTDLPDAGPIEAGSPIETEAGVEGDAGDSGEAPEETTENDVEGDAAAPEGDGGGGAEPTPCEQACAAAAEQGGCEDNSTCEATMCEIREVNANCEAEADAYLACIGDSEDPDDFECAEEGTPQYVGGCDIQPWVACLEAPVE